MKGYMWPSIEKDFLTLPSATMMENRLIFMEFRIYLGSAYSFKMKCNQLTPVKHLSY